MPFITPVLKLLAWRIVAMPGRSFRGPLPVLSPEEQELKERLARHVHVLATEFGDRSVGSIGLRAAQHYIADIFASLGYPVQAHEFDFDGHRLCNLVAEVKGESPDEIVVVGAHYDTVPGSPGADDNASGVAALLEIMRALSELRPSRTLRFVAFSNEEHCFAPAETMGSYIYARECRAASENIVAMLSLEMLGVYSDAPGSQKYPKPFHLFYPDVADFVAFVTTATCRSLVRKCVALFRRHARFPSEGGAAPKQMRDAERSDHWGFLQFGYPALMVTDTSNFRYLHYHGGGDTPDKLDFERLARVTAGLSEVVRSLAEEASL